MKGIMVVLCLFLTISAICQNTYKKGVYTDNEGNVREGLILDMDWRSNPSSIKFRLNMASTASTLELNQIQSFEISESSRYVRATIEVDTSREQVDKLSKNRNPEFGTETVLLKLLVDGKYKLFKLQKGEMVRYYYSVNNSPEIIPLVFKSYISRNELIKKNYQFRQQLANDVACNAQEKEKAHKLEYSQRSLEKYFLRQSDCNNINIKRYSNKKKDQVIYLRLKPGLNISALKAGEQGGFAGDLEFGTKITPRIGLELEYILPFNNDKWSIFTEPNFQYYKSQVERNNNEHEVDYKSVELPLGIRYHMYINDSGQIFANSIYSFDFAIDSYVNRVNGAGGLDLTSSTSARNNFQLGLGYRTGKLSGELRYSFQNNLTGDYFSYDSKFNRLSVILGYQIL